MMQLVTVIVVVLFAVPALLYLVGLAARRYVGSAPSCQSALKIDPYMECAPRGGQIGRFELTPLAGLLENGSHDETPIPQRRIQTAGC